MKYTCKICGNPFKNSISITNHLKSHKISNENYYRKYLLKQNEGFCLTCGKPTNFKSIEHGYSYEYNGTRNYYPDFLVEDNYVELKGSHFF